MTRKHALRITRQDERQASCLTDTTIPVGRCVIRTALSVVLTCCPPAPPDRNVSMRKSLGSIATLPSLESLPPRGASGNTCTPAKEVCRRFYQGRVKPSTHSCSVSESVRILPVRGFIHNEDNKTSADLCVKRGKPYEPMDASFGLEPAKCVVTCTPHNNLQHHFWVPARKPPQVFVNHPLHDSHAQKSER